MAGHEAEAVMFERGDAKALPHTLSGTRHLTLALMATDAGSGLRPSSSAIPRRSQTPR